MRTAAYLLLLLAIAATAFVARCWNLRDVFVDGQVYFADGDCYSRMTRARMVSEGAGWSIRHHDFENHPQGTTPHTTALLDWMLVGGARALDWAMHFSDPEAKSIARQQALDVTGAFSGPVLGALACLIAGLALPRSRPRSFWLPLAGATMLAVCPILVHGTVLGRPDHQGLLILLTVFIVCAELQLLDDERRGWAIAAGLAWGLALWVSLYEPLLLAVLTLAGLLFARRKAFRSADRAVELAVALGVFALGVVIDGWRIPLPDAAAREAFARWSQSIFELRPLAATPGVLWQWFGWAFPLVIGALAWNWRSSRESRLLVWLLLGTIGLTLWQLRWGYFLAAIYALGLPFAMRAVSRTWVAWSVVVAGLWPVAAGWEAQLFPGDAEERRRFVARWENVSLRWIAEAQRERNAGPFIAPWWLSPAIAYWSRQPGVAGTSHQSLPGIEDTARVYLAPDVATAWPILERRGVKWIVGDDPGRLIPTSAQVLGTTPPDHTLAHHLEGAVLPPPDTLSIVRERAIRGPLGNDIFPVWRVRPEAPPANLQNQ